MSPIFILATKGSDMPQSLPISVDMERQLQTVSPSEKANPAVGFLQLHLKLYNLKFYNFTLEIKSAF